MAHGGALRVLGELCGYTWVNFGVVSDSTAAMLHRRNAWARPEYREILIMGCLNDLVPGRPSSWTIDNLKRLYRAARKARARVVAVTSTPWGRYPRWTADLQRYQDDVLSWLGHGADGLADVVVDAYTSLLERGSRVNLNPMFSARDGLHLNATGQRILGEVIVEQAYQGVPRCGS